MSVSGAARAAELLSSALAPHSDVTVASMLNKGDAGGTISRPWVCKRIATRSWLPLPVPWSKLSNRYKTLFYKSDLPDIVRKGNFDIVHLHNPMPGLEMERVARACRARRIPYVVSTHGYNEIVNGAEVNHFGPLRRLIWNQLALRPVQRVTRHADAVFALSPADFEIVRHMGFEGINLTVVSNGVIPPASAEPADDLTIVTRLGIPPKEAGQITCMFLANHSPNKGLPVLLEAFASLQQPYLLIVGGEKRSHIAYERYIRSCGPGQRIILTGLLTDREVEALFRRSDLFVFPTLADTFPLVVLEAMASGLPVVASSVGGIPYQLTEQCGVLVPPGDARQIASAVEMLSHQPERLLAMGRSARARVATEFTWGLAAKRALAGYQAVLQRHS
ncbi:MAG: glycosyltransferase family 4 protein [Methylocella sp.]